MPLRSTEAKQRSQLARFPLTIEKTKRFSLYFSVLSALAREFAEPDYRSGVYYMKWMRK